MAGTDRRGLAVAADSSTCIRAFIDAMTEVRLCSVAARSVVATPWAGSPTATGTEGAPRWELCTRGVLGVGTDGLGWVAA